MEYAMAGVEYIHDMFLPQCGCTGQSKFYIAVWLLDPIFIEHSKLQ